jgi:hypothetical protein
VRSARRAVLSAFVAGFLLHTLAAAIAWRSWGGLRSGVLVWADFPVSLAYLQLTGRSLLAASLLAGGLQWGAIAALLAYWLGSALRKARRG